MNIIDDIGQTVFLRNNFQFSGFDFGEVQHIVNDFQQNIACIANIIRIGTDFFIPAFSDYHFIHTQHCIDRGPYLM